MSHFYWGNHHFGKLNAVKNVLSVSIHQSAVCLPIECDQRPKPVATVTSPHEGQNL